MKRALLLTSCLLAIGSAPLLAHGEDVTYQSSAVPDSARFVVMQPHSGVIFAIRLDRFTGDTWLATPNRKANGRNPGHWLVWQKIKRVPAPNDPMVPGKVNYQVFSGAITVLTNTTTGASWELTRNQLDEWEFWDPMLIIPNE